MGDRISHHVIVFTDEHVDLVDRHLRERIEQIQRHRNLIGITPEEVAVGRAEEVLLREAHRELTVHARRIPG